jgi:hypothetical protein
MAPTTYYVSDQSGNNIYTGSQYYPVKTNQCAANLAKPGDTILVYPGIYRERVSPPMGGSPTLPITYKSIVPQGAIIRGSIPWIPQSSVPKKKSVIYVSPLVSSDFTDTSAIDGANPFKIPLSVTPYGRNGAPEVVNKEPNSDSNMIYTLGQVFVNDEMYTQCPYQIEMENTDKSWFYDLSLNQLYVNVPKNSIQPKIEITNQRRLFAPHVRGLRNIVVDGFIIERCGNNYPNKFWNIPQNQQAGAIGTRCGKFWTIQNNIIRYANGIGIDWGNEGGADQDLEISQTPAGNGKTQGANGHSIKNNIISDNGAAGTASYMCKNVLFIGNTVERNNNLKFYGKYRWESAGLKMHCPSNSIIANNLIRNNYCHGIWCDQGAGVNSIIKNNIIIENQQSGINFEIGLSTSGKVINNIFDNNEYGVSFSTSGGVLVAYNLFLSSKTADIYTNIFPRIADKWDSLNIEIYYNIFMKSPMYLQLTCPQDGVSSRFMNYNQYNGLSNQQKFQMISADGKTKLSMPFEKWQTTWSKYNTDTNCDENSILSSFVNVGILEEINSGEYVFKQSIIPILFDYKKIFESQTDYFGIKDRAPDIYGKCIAGPFSKIEEQCIKLIPAVVSK